MSVHSVSLKGKRPQNEDKHSYIMNLDGKNTTSGKIDYYAVYDGHGGKFVSKYLHSKLPEYFIDKRVKYPLSASFVKNVYNHISETLKNEYSEKSYNTGSTCLVVIRFKQGDCDYLNILNTGDSRCVICKNNLGIPLTKDHKPNWPEESARIKKLGGEIVFDGFDWRIQDLSVSRAFGDVCAEPYVTCMPDIFRYKLSNNDKFIVLACDGLWDVLQTQDVVNAVLDCCYDNLTNERINTHINIAKKLADLAIAKGSNDNVTVIVVFFK